MLAGLWNGSGQNRPHTRTPPPAHTSNVEVLTTQVGVARRGHHLEEAAVDAQQRHIKRAWGGAMEWRRIYTGILECWENPSPNNTH